MDIYMMDLTGKNVVKLTEIISWDSRNPFFSTDGKWIVFSSDEDGDSDIYLLDPLGKGMINLTNNNVNDYYPSFSP
jgi:TolB protein